MGEFCPSLHLKDRPHRLARSRTSDFHSGNRGSNPLGVNIESEQRFALLAMPESLAQLVEHLTFNEGVDGSSPSGLNPSQAILNQRDRLFLLKHAICFCSYSAPSLTSQK
jgi:hypothetical protein